MAILVQRKGSASLVSSSTTGGYRISLLDASSNVLSFLPIFGTGGHIVANFAPMSPAALPSPDDVKQVVMEWRERLVRYVRVLCSASIIQIRELMVFDETMTNVAFGKFANSSSPAFSAAGANYEPSSAVNGVLQNDVQTDSDGFVSALNCGATGTNSHYFMLDLGANFNVTRIIFFNRKSTADTAAAGRMNGAPVQLLNEFGTIIASYSLALAGTYVPAAQTINVILTAPSASASPTMSGSTSVSATPTSSLTASATPSQGAEASLSGSNTPSSSATASITGSSSSTASTTGTASITPTPGWNIPVGVRLLSTVAGVDVHAVELFVFATDGSLVSACTGVPHALRATLEADATAVSAASFACDLQADWTGGNFARISAPAPRLASLSLNFTRRTAIAQAVWVARKGTGTLSALATSGNYLFQLLGFNGAVVASSSAFATSGGLAVADFAPYSLPAVPEDTATSEVDPDRRATLVRTVRILCSASIIQIRELYVFDHMMRNVALNKPTSTNAEGTTGFTAATAVDGIISSDLADTNGFASSVNCATSGTGSVWWELDLQHNVNVTKLVFFNRNGPTNAATRMNLAPIQLLNFYGDVLQTFTISTTNSPSAMTFDVRLALPSLTATPSASVTASASNTASISMTASVSASRGTSPTPTMTNTPSNTASSSTTATGTATPSPTPTPSSGWLVPQFARLAAMVEGYNVHAVELLMFDVNGVVISACTAAGIPSSLAASASVSGAVSGQSVSAACDLTMDSMNSGYMAATPSPAPGLSWYRIRFPRAAQQPAYAMLVQRKGARDLTSSSVNGRYVLELLASDAATVVASRPMQGSGNLVAASFANYSLPQPALDLASAFQQDEVARRRFARYVRVACSSSRLNVRELIVLDNNLVNVALGKTVTTNSESTTGNFTSADMVNGVVNGDTEAETEGFISAGECSGAPGSLYAEVDLGGLYNVSRVILLNRLTSVDGTVVFNMVGATVTVLDFYRNTLASFALPATPAAAATFVLPALGFQTATATNSLTASASATATNTASVTSSPTSTRSVGGTPAPTSSGSSSVSGSPSPTATSTSSPSATRSSTATPTVGWDLPLSARLAATASGADVQAAELLIFATDGTLMSACSGVAPALLASPSVSLAVSGQTVNSACDAAGIDHLNSGYMRATVSSNSLPFYAVRFAFARPIAQAILVQRKGSSDLSGYSVTARYQLQLLNAVGGLVDSRPMQSRGGNVVANFAPFAGIANESATPVDDALRSRLVRFVRVVCPAGGAAVARELMVLDERNRLISVGKAVTASDGDVPATAWSSPGSLTNAIIESDIVNPESDGYVSSTCTAAGDRFLQLDLGSVFTVSRVSWWNRVLSSDATVGAAMNGGSIQLLSEDSEVLSTLAIGATTAAALTWPVAISAIPPSITTTPTTTRSATPPATQSRSATPTSSGTRSGSSTPSGTPSITASPSSTVSGTKSGTPSRTGTASSSATRSRTGTTSSSETSSVSATASETASVSATASPTSSVSSSGTGTPSGSQTVTGTPSVSGTATGTQTGTAAATGTGTAASTGTPSPSATATVLPSSTGTKTMAAFAASTSRTATKTRTRTASRTKTKTKTKTRSPTKKKKLLRQ